MAKILTGTCRGVTKTADTVSGAKVRRGYMSQTFGTACLWIAPAKEAPCHLSVLSPAERIRAEGMHPAGRPAFVTARGLLRRRLARMIGLSPEAVPLTQQPGQAPVLEGHAYGPYFSVSHTQLDGRPFAAVAVSSVCPIGIDLEDPARAVDWRRMAARRLHPGEWAAIAARDDGTARQMFFDLWCLKEALVKLMGVSLLPVLSRTRIVLDRPPRLLDNAIDGRRHILGLAHVRRRRLTLGMAAARTLDWRLYGAD